MAKFQRQTPVRGCRDFGPRAAQLRRAIVTRFASLAHCFGFDEVELPLLERFSIFQSALGETSDVVSSEMFHVLGPASTSREEAQRVVLRPEGTAGAARAFAPRRSGEISRLWYAGPMFRYERPQRQRLRQFVQLGVECLGDASVESDIDCITLAHRFLQTTSGGRECTLAINTLGTRADRAEFNARLRDHIAPQVADLSPVSRLRYESGNFLRILDSKLWQDMQVMQGAPSLCETVGEQEKTRLTRIQYTLRQIGIPHRVDPTLVRGLDYYTGIAFEFIDESGRAACAGGRYSDLNGCEGVGFAAGLERLEPGLCDQSIQSDLELIGGPRGGIAIVMMTPSTDPVSAEALLAVRVADKLRSLSLRSTVSRTPGRIGKTVGRAIRDGARAVVVIGSEEVVSGTVRLKLVLDNASADDHGSEVVPLDELVSKLSHLVNRTS